MQVKSRPIVCVLAFSAAALLSAQLVIAQQQKLATPEKLTDGILLRFRDSFLELEVCTDSVIHITFSKDRTFSMRQTLAATPKRCEASPWKFSRGLRDVFVTTAKLRIKVDLATGAVSFFDRNGLPVAMERKNGRTLTPVEVQGEKTLLELRPVATAPVSDNDAHDDSITFCAKRRRTNRSPKRGRKFQTHR
jgi:hypothetical protein